MFDFDAVVHEAKGEPHEFKAAGKQWRVPHISELTVGQQRAADLGMFELIMRDVGEVWDEKAEEWRPAGDAGAAIFLGKHNDQIGAFKAAWLAHAGLKPGESRASSR